MLWLDEVRGHGESESRGVLFENSEEGDQYLRRVHSSNTTIEENRTMPMLIIFWFYVGISRNPTVAMIL
jgi:hypothetical protein